jgi:hypothetical protein
MGFLAFLGEIFTLKGEIFLPPRGEKRPEKGVFGFVNPLVLCAITKRGKSIAPFFKKFPHFPLKK